MTSVRVSLLAAVKQSEYIALVGSRSGTFGATCIKAGPSISGKRRLPDHGQVGSAAVSDKDDTGQLSR